MQMVRLRGPTTDAQLLAAADSDPDAFARFYERHETLLMGYFRRRVADPETAADLAAEVFAAALDAASRYRPGGATAVAWLLTIAHNLVAGGQKAREPRPGALRTELERRP
jgi:DNA-directed RNA polymerase specialized sigma24 family protein